jgi:succinate dehydrogenase / fumarate reductase flavoprotein subunit
MQGAELKNLEFIQYHPTTILTTQKRMLVSEAARGEGGRLFYERDGERVYFMEDKYGSSGNLMSRDIVSREIYAAPGQVYLDLAFLNKKLIDERLPEVRDLCRKYADLDVMKEPIPVEPSVHFFMGGLAVHDNHETSIRDLYAVGECASKYHGANRLGGNSLLAAIYSGITAAESISKTNNEKHDTHPGFRDYIEEQNRSLEKHLHSESSFPVTYIRDMLAKSMESDLGIVRDERSLVQGIEEIDYYLSIADHIRYDDSVLPYFNYSLKGILTLARAVVTCANERRESRGAHYRSDNPDSLDEYAYSSVISFNEGSYNVRLDKENIYES